MNIINTCNDVQYVTYFPPQDYDSNGDGQLDATEVRDKSENDWTSTWYTI